MTSLILEIESCPQVNNLYTVVNSNMLNLSHRSRVEVVVQVKNSLTCTMCGHWLLLGYEYHQLNNRPDCGKRNVYSVYVVNIHAEFRKKLLRSRWRNGLERVQQ